MGNDFNGNIGGETYDQYVQTIPGFMEMQEQIADIVREKAGATSDLQDSCTLFQIIELGVGTGITTHHILDALKGGLYLRGVDKSAEMLDVFKTKIRYAPQYCFIEDNLYGFKFIEKEIPPCRVVEIRQGVANHFIENMKRNTAHAIVSAATIHNMPADYRRSLLYDIKIALKPEGIFVIADKIAVDDYAEHLNNLVSELRCLDGFPEIRDEWLAHYEFDEQPDIKLKESDLERTLKDTGFQDIKKVWRLGLNAIYTAQKPK